MEENKKLPLKPRFIQGKSFEPYESWLLPGEIHMQGTREGDIVKDSGCFRYKIVKVEEQRNSGEDAMFSCFFIAEHTGDKDFIKDQAMQLLLAGCRNFDFYGAMEPIWHMVVDEADITLNPDSTSETVALISGWSRIEYFVDALDIEIFKIRVLR